MKRHICEREGLCAFQVWLVIRIEENGQILSIRIIRLPHMSFYNMHIQNRAFFRL